MIAYIEGKVLQSTNSEIILLTSAGIGHLIHYDKMPAIGTELGLYIAHIIKEDSETLFGFSNFHEKKFFELLLGVKGVGPKSAFSLMVFLGPVEIRNSIVLQNPAGLKRAPGIGAKAAAQIILDLKDKILMMDKPALENKQSVIKKNVATPSSDILGEAIMAFKELGFKEEKVVMVAQRLLLENEINRAEQLVELVLREL